jgi:hypothetical protein
VSWSGPGRGRAYAFVARAVGDEIVLEGSNAVQELRWIFSEISLQRFRLAQ